MKRSVASTMPTLSRLLLLLSMGTSAIGCREPEVKASQRPIPRAVEKEPAVPRRFARTRQLIVVLGEGWNEPRAQLFRFERSRGDAVFERVAPIERAMVGRAGLGVGRGLVALPFGGAPPKVEGDDRAPAGLFTLEKVFGVGANAETRLPYLAMTDEDICVDDVNHADYGRLVRLGPPSPKSFERMKRADALYELGITIGHNAAREPGLGSCIFLHVWRSPETATSGCTALARENVFAIARSLDSEKAPLLLQLPKGELTKLAPVLEELGLSISREDGQKKK